MLSVTDFDPKGIISGFRVQAGLYLDMLDPDRSPNAVSVRPDNLVPALKQALFSTFEHSLVLSKNRTFSSTNWENEHYFETLSALTVKIRTSFNHCFNFEC